MRVLEQIGAALAGEFVGVFGFVVLGGLVVGAGQTWRQRKESDTCPRVERTHDDSFE
jgi:hypothetical protein